MSASALPTAAADRKNIPMVRGLLDYFPAALAEVAVISRLGNEQHNPGEEMYWARGKSADHADCIVRHLADRGTVDPLDGARHSAKLAWRALALLQMELEEAGLAPLSRGSRAPEPSKPPLKSFEEWCGGSTTACQPDCLACQVSYKEYVAANR